MVHAQSAASEAVSPIHDTQGGEMPDSGKMSEFSRRLKADLPIVKMVPVGTILFSLASVGILAGVGAYLVRGRRSVSGN